MSSETQIASIQTETLPEAPGKIESSWTSFVPIVLIFVVFYFFLIRPQEKRKKEHEMLITSVKKGEEILTTGGIIGKVVKVNESEPTIQVEIAENTIIKISKNAVSDIISRKTQGAVEAKTEENKKITEKKKTGKSKN